jgi:hypothetical protein
VSGGQRCFYVYVMWAINRVQVMLGPTCFLVSFCGVVNSCGEIIMCCIC